MTYKYPYSIQNNSGEKIIFKGIVIRNGVEYLEAYNEVQPKAGPPMHVHHKQDEFLKVITGKMGYQELNGMKKYAGPGEGVEFKAGVPHKFWNAGDDLLTCTGYISPAHNIIYFLDEIYKSADKNGGRPGLFDAAFLISKYRSEFDMLEIPGFVKRFIFPVTLALGNLTGKNKRFSDAPQPVL